MNVQYPYRSVICGEEHIVKGWHNGNLLTNKGEFVFSQLFEDKSIYAARILEIALVRSNETGDWILNGQNIQLLQSLPAGDRFFCITDDENLRVYKDEVCAAVWIQTNGIKDVTRLLDKLLRTWKIVSQPIEVKKHLSPNGQLLTGLENTFSALVTLKDWGRPIWLTKFQHTGQIVNPLEKKLALPQLTDALAATEHKATNPHRPKLIADTKTAVESEKSTPDFFTGIEAAAKYIGVSSRTIINWKNRSWLKVEQNGKKIRIARVDLDKCKNRQ